MKVKFIILLQQEIATATATATVTATATPTVTAILLMLYKLKEQLTNLPLVKAKARNCSFKSFHQWKLKLSSLILIRIWWSLVL